MWTGCSDPTDMARRGSSKIKHKRDHSRFHLTCWGWGWRRAEERKEQDETLGRNPEAEMQSFF